jgi:exopolyphosphatase/guanosine-5'-triphosphate,3'-diphosphate pyrophosphatase
MFNEKAICALGQGMLASGLLNPDGVEPAFQSVSRFIRLARAMEVDALHVLATSAVRDAADGARFARRIEDQHGVVVQILSGGEEATLSALGVLCGSPDAMGLVADIGGGSLELARVSAGEIGERATLPLGVLRLYDASEGSRERAFTYVEQNLDSVSWFDRVQGESLYAVGGAWRALARICIAQINHPLLVLDNFSLDAEEAMRVISLVALQSRKSLEKIPGVARKRLPSLPLAALALERLMLRARPRRLVFSIFGMREGRFFQDLSPEVQRQDPLIAECIRMADLAGRFPEHGDEMLDWTGALFPRETQRQRRLRHAACVIGDIFWNEHPDYRAEQAFLRVLRLPFLGLEHQDRAALALAVHTRYQGDENSILTGGVETLLDEEASSHARLTGMALRLGHTLSGGAPDILRRTRLMVDDNTLVLEVADDDWGFVADSADRQFERLSRSLGCGKFQIRRRAA